MNPKYSPIYLIRAYLWAVLQENTEMDAGDYGGLNPIVPVAEEPELTQYNKPYIVYGYANDSTGDLYAIQRGSASFAVYSTNFGEITTILNVMAHALGRQDESAKDVNHYTSTIPQFVGIRFGSIEVGFIEGGTPEDTEGGRQSGILNIRYTYFVDYNVITRIPPAPQSEFMGLAVSDAGAVEILP